MSPVLRGIMQNKWGFFSNDCKCSQLLVSATWWKSNMPACHQYTGIIQEQNLNLQRWKDPIGFTLKRSSNQIWFEGSQQIFGWERTGLSTGFLLESNQWWQVQILSAPVPVPFIFNENICRELPKYEGNQFVKSTRRYTLLFKANERIVEKIPTLEWILVLKYNLISPLTKTLFPLTKQLLTTVDCQFRKYRFSMFCFFFLFFKLSVLSDIL